MHRLIVLVMCLVLGPVAAHAAIVVPQPRIFPSIKNAYNSIPQQHVLMVLHMPPGSGKAFVEIHNRTRQEISLLQFTLTAMGQKGDLDFDDLPPGWSAVKEVKLSTLRELAIRNVKAFNSNADEISPRLVIHMVKSLGGVQSVGKRKL
jgi:hypothetical protein